MTKLSTILVCWLGDGFGCDKKLCIPFLNSNSRARHLQQSIQAWNLQEHESRTAAFAPVIVEMTAHNVGALVVLKSGDVKQLAGIVTERDFARKILLPGRPSEETRVDDIMTEENKLITVSSKTNILRAMELMTDKHIRHVPVFDEKVVGMISIGDVVKAIVDQQHQEVKQLKKYITGDYY